MQPMSTDSARKIRVLATLSAVLATLYDGATVSAIASVSASVVVYCCVIDSEIRLPPWLAAIDEDIQYKIRVLATLYVGVSVIAPLYAGVSVIASVIVSVSASVSAVVSASVSCRPR